MSRDEFVNQCMTLGAERIASEFLWDHLSPYYRAPLTPHPEDKLISAFSVDPEDMSDMIEEFAKAEDRTVGDVWVGPEDPNLAEFALAFTSMTSAK